VVYTYLDREMDISQAYIIIYILLGLLVVSIFRHLILAWTDNGVVSATRSYNCCKIV